MTNFITSNTSTGNFFFGRELEPQEIKCPRGHQIFTQTNIYIGSSVILNIKLPYKTRITYFEDVLISLTTFSVISKSLTFEDHYCSLHWKISICYSSHLGWYANAFLYQKSTMFFSNQTLWWYQPTARIGASRFGFFPSNNFFLLSRRSISDCFNGDESGAQEESMFHPISN